MVNFVELILGIILVYFGYRIADETRSADISNLATIVAIIGIILILAGAFS